jgi:23S rRNA (cytidine1920-2'-O)/16S rRNA (cytidine1409-2'-O)-methyltransferase
MARPAPKKRLDELLVDLGLVPDLRVAGAHIMAGKVVVGGVVCSKPGTRVRTDADVHHRGVDGKYASRGGLKLEAALQRFAVSVEGRVVLDAGASTGGFTDCLLQHGAKRVYAVDVGYGQLRGRIAADPRVVSMERTNIGDLHPGMFDPPFDLCVFDLSYLSTTKAAPSLKALFTGPVEMIGLVKPPFERVPQEGMRDVDLLRDALHRVVAALGSASLSVVGLMVSPILGGRGSVEFLAHMRAGPPSEPAVCELAITELRGELPKLLASLDEA